MKNWGGMFIFIAAVLGGCGGGGSDDDGGANGAGGGFTPEPRPPSDNMPVEHAGTQKNNVRVYDFGGAFHAQVSVSGVAGELLLQLGADALEISTDGVYVFPTSYDVGEQVSLQIATQPDTQTCALDGPAELTISATENVSYFINCVHELAPEPPELLQAFSALSDRIDLSWSPSVDYDSAAADIRYEIYWGTVQADVESRVSSSYQTGYGVESHALTGLLPGTEYFIAIDARDADGYGSAPGEVLPLSTVSRSTALKDVTYHLLDAVAVSQEPGSLQAGDAEFSQPPLPGDYVLVDTGTAVDYFLVNAVVNNAGIYTLSVSTAEVTDLFDVLAISSNSVFDMTEELGGKQAAKSRGSGEKDARDIVGRAANIPALCRSLSTELTAIEQEAVTLTVFSRFTPRLRVNLELDDEGPEPELLGKIRMSGATDLGAELNLTMTDDVAGAVECSLSRFPIKTARFYVIPGLLIPVYQEFSLDVGMRLDFAAKSELNAGYGATTSLEFSASFENTGDGWQSSESASLSVSEYAYLDYAAGMNGRLAILPTVSTTINKLATVSLDGNAGVDASIVAESIAITSPLAEITGLPFKISEFNAGANALFDLDAQLGVGAFVASINDVELYQTPTFQIFSLPLVCTNAASSPEDCEHETDLSVEDIDQAAGVDLEVFLVDGTNNPVDMSSLTWLVTPSNGWLETDENNPRLVTFKPGDAGSYKVIASAHGYLGDPARQLAVFNIGGECGYGLGRTLTPDEAATFNLNIGGDYAGYQFENPDDVVYDPELDYTETCKFTEDEGFINLTIDFYGGNANGAFEVIRDYGGWVETMAGENERGKILSATREGVGGGSRQTLFRRYIDETIDGNDARFADYYIYQNYQDGVLRDKRITSVSGGAASQTFYQYNSDGADIWGTATCNVNMSMSGDLTDSVVFPNSSRDLGGNYTYDLLSCDLDTYVSYFPNGRVYQSYDGGAYIQCGYDYRDPEFGLPDYPGGYSPGEVGMEYHCVSMAPQVTRLWP